MSDVRELAHTAKQAARILRRCTPEQKNDALKAIAYALEQERDTLFEANQRDVLQAQKNSAPPHRIDRLTLHEARLQEIIKGVHHVAALQDPVGECMEQIDHANGMRIEKVRVPFGVIAIIYEARPNVTVDAAVLALKSGNAVVLRGGTEAQKTNKALIQTMRRALQNTSVPSEAIQFVDDPDRKSIDALLGLRGLVDLAIPRGGAALIKRVVETARVPVIETGVGNCHIYIDRFANPEMAIAIVHNAKCSRPSVCNAAETLLLHRACMDTILPQILSDLTAAQVELRLCNVSYDRFIEKFKAIKRATESDYREEFLDDILAVRVVNSMAEAIAHIETYGTNHSEAIVTEDSERADFFLANVDAAAVYHNASTRFTDGFEFGFGAEIGISTQKMHARGPMGLRELTSYQYQIHGQGQTRL
ncbi:glutamate-5-semialdehyde dehydrogenase [Ferroacidibacillus organovorans]|uniref:Gamma-glutamyl phosphate reductase n=1 Tax=Ferroacidibacillus organovorans TaxID=1765683 RepID=A0A124IWA8_9BACL|nr:glutamate-5-semialdehyde dehydrogenase [Ferroacidibacillus organovorans]KUO96830.1 gamma-glutamyl-phosphate reductase [Ferroacidibacillus organovorans]